MHIVSFVEEIMRTLLICSVFTIVLTKILL